MPTRLTGAVIAALCLTAPALAQTPPIFIKMVCGYAGYRTCYVDPADYGEPRTRAGCLTAAVKAWPALDATTVECVEMRVK